MPHSVAIVLVMKNLFAVKFASDILRKRWRNRRSAHQSKTLRKNQSKKDFYEKNSLVSERIRSLAKYFQSSVK